VYQKGLLIRNTEPSEDSDPFVKHWKAPTNDFLSARRGNNASNPNIVKRDMTSDLDPSNYKPGTKFRNRNNSTQITLEPKSESLMEPEFAEASSRKKSFLSPKMEKIDESVYLETKEPPQWNQL
jgi:hypothetical protein